MDSRGPALETSPKMNATSARLSPGHLTTPNPFRPITADAGRKQIEDALKRLSRAVQQFHVYPAGSPTCVEAIRACRRALVALDCETLVCTVGVDVIVVDGESIGADGLIGRELAKRLWTADVASLEIRRDVTPRSLSRFCEALLAAQTQEGGSGLPRRLADDDIEGVSVRVAARPEILDLHATVPQRQLGEQQRQWRAVQDKRAPSAHLYPPERGWVRMDPGFDCQTLSLHDMAVLVDDPSILASMLDRLAGRTSANGDASNALVDHFGEIARIVEALEPSLARRAFARLGQAVLALDTKRRTRLLESTVLPGLLEGRAEGALLHALPDVNLADALALILDAETAAPELLLAALDRLNLSVERRDVVVPLLEERIRTHAASTDATRQRDTALEERAQRLVRVVTGEAKSFREFVGLDLAMDRETEGVLASTQGSIDSTDGALARLHCTVALVRQSRNADAIGQLMPSVVSLLSALAREDRWHDVASVLTALSAYGEVVEGSHPEAAEVVRAGLASVVDVDFIERLARLHEDTAVGRAAVGAMVGALGSALARPAIECLARDLGTDSGGRIADLLSAHAARFAPVLTVLLPGLQTAVAVAVVRALGRAASGSEWLLAQQLDRGDEQVVREVLRALVRIGSPAAAQAVVAHLQREGAAGLATAEGALWSFRPELSRAGARELLAQPQFVARHGALTLRILDRLAQVGTTGVEHTLTTLTPLRLRFWNPSLARIGRRARSLLKESR
jgi:hypothetical protein